MASPVVLQLQPEFAYSMLVFVLSAFQLIWMSIKVGAARKKYGVKYPDMYSDKSPMFNCVQRVHQNTLEGYTLFLALMFLGALKHPVLSAAGGVVVISGRFFYAFGYYTGDPSKRQRGGWFHIGELICLGCLISGALTMLGLEAYPIFLALMFLGALKHPVLSAAGGVVVISGRFVYAVGYYTGDPSKRLRGSWLNIGLIICLGCLISGALTMLGYI